jgi:hypothetical protein
MTSKGRKKCTAKPVPQYTWQGFIAYAESFGQAAVYVSNEAMPSSCRPRRRLVSNSARGSIIVSFIAVWLLLPASRSELRGNSRVVPASLDSEAVLAQESKRSAPHSEANLVLGLKERGLFSPAFWRALLE